MQLREIFGVYKSKKSSSSTHSNWISDYINSQRRKILCNKDVKNRTKNIGSRWGLASKYCLLFHLWKPKFDFDPNFDCHKKHRHAPELRIFIVYHSYRWSSSNLREWEGPKSERSPHNHLIRSGKPQKYASRTLTHSNTTALLKRRQKAQY